MRKLLSWLEKRKERREREREYWKSVPRQGELVTIVHNETGEEFSGRIWEFTPNRITLAQTFNAKEFSFKERDKK